MSERTAVIAFFSVIVGVGLVLLFLVGWSVLESGAFRP